MAQSVPAVGALRIPVPRVSEGWEIADEDEMAPQSEGHDLAVDLLRTILRYWAKTSGMRICRDLATRWVKENYRVGVDPDLSVLRPIPVPEGELYSNLTWLPDYAPPLIAVEVVSRSNAAKDYSIAPDKYAASGTTELWIFDPGMAGPKAHGGPHRLQIYHRNEQGDLERIYVGDGPARSPSLGAWLVVTEGGRKLRIADDEHGRTFWPTEAEAARAEAEAARAEADGAHLEIARLKAEIEALKNR